MGQGPPRSVALQGRICLIWIQSKLGAGCYRQGKAGYVWNSPTSTPPGRGLLPTELSEMKHTLVVKCRRKIFQTFRFSKRPPSPWIRSNGPNVINFCELILWIKDFDCVDNPICTVESSYGSEAIWAIL